MVEQPLAPAAAKYLSLDPKQQLRPTAPHHLKRTSFLGHVNLICGIQKVWETNESTSRTQTGIQEVGDKLETKEPQRLE